MHQQELEEKNQSALKIILVKISMHSYHDLINSVFETHYSNLEFS